MAIRFARTTATHGNQTHVVMTNEPARVRKAVEVVPELTAASTAKRARERISLLVDADVLEAWRASGPGWQPRMNALLREHKP
jgi:uncharacterized protein (DUF4415 family)